MYLYLSCTYHWCYGSILCIFMHHLFMEYIWDITDLLTVNLWDIFDNFHSFVKVMEFIEL